MNAVKDIIWNGFKNTSVAMTFGAIQLYVMDEKWKKQQEIRRIEDEKIKAMLEEIKELAKAKPTFGIQKCW